MTDRKEHETRSPLLPTDPFEIELTRLVGLPNGAHTQPTVVQSVDFYKNASRYIVQTIKWDEGLSVFITHIKPYGQAVNLELPPAVTKLLLRQFDAVSTMVRRRQGQRLAETQRANGHRPVFTPAMRAKALATRKAKAAQRAARRAKKR